MAEMARKRKNHCSHTKDLYLSVMFSVMGMSMPVTFDRTVFTAGGSLRINLPTPITKALNIKVGDRLTISLNDSQIVMEKTVKKK